ncbi:hypothetical protein [uncultured Chryseobacterium sp.]|uniref:hypothetical protein n=1 Tax=uncultured Chryseobacterium sp. TaxID=259322 RepID=UPI0025E66998|nr:hypothetical protein [uncultured Chryseobacterium sp.]
MLSKQELKKLFENGDIPKQEDFWQWQESYFHKEDVIPADNIQHNFSAKADLVEGKVPAKQLPDHVKTIQKPVISGNIISFPYTTKDDLQENQQLDLTDFKNQVISAANTGYKGYLKIDDKMPSVQGLYRLLETGSYINLVPAVDNTGASSVIVADEDKLNEAYYDGSKWIKSDIAVNNNPSIERALEGFLDTGSVNETILLNKGFENFSINGTTPRYRNEGIDLLLSNNTSVVYNEANISSYLWIDVPTKISNTEKISRINVSLVRIGGSPSRNPYHANLLGVKKNGDIEVLIANISPDPSGTLENLSFDLSSYISFSLMLINNGSTNIGLGSVVKIYKSELKSSNVKLYIDNKINGENKINVLDYGVIRGKEVDNTVIKKNTDIINTLISDIILAGGGILKFPSGDYCVNQIEIPDVVNWFNVKLEGEFIPAQRFGTITVPNVYDPDINKPNGTTIISKHAGHGIIYCKPGNSYSNFNLGMLTVENLTLRAYDNPQICGIDAWSIAQLYVKNVVIDTGIYNVNSTEPTYETSGIVTPKNSNGALTMLENIAISGFKHGIKVFEHTNGNSLQIQSCKNALSFYDADHASYFSRCCLQRNTNQVSVFGNHVFEIAQLNMEYAGNGQTNSVNAWQSTQYEINDSDNLGIGNISYANVKGNLGKVNTMRINGASGILIKRIGSENRVIQTIPSP